MKTKNSTTVSKQANKQASKKQVSKPRSKKQVSKPQGKQASKPKTDIYTTKYGKQVLTVNKELKKQSKSLGGCRSILLTLANEIGLTPLHKTLLNKSKKAENYKLMLKDVRFYKLKDGSHSYSPFYLLQALYKNAEKWQKEFK